MSTEPVTIFARIHDIAGVARCLRARDPHVSLDGPDDDWRNATVTIGASTLRFTHDPARYEPAKWALQMRGLQGYLGRLPFHASMERVLLLPTTFRLALGTIFAPEETASADPRRAFVAEVATLLDGVLFKPSGLSDPHGRVLEHASLPTDPHATWPRVTGRFARAMPVGERLHEVACPPALYETAVGASDAVRIARRALALTAVAARGMAELDAKDDAAIGLDVDLRRWLAELGVEDELESAERHLLAAPLGANASQEMTDALWRVEGAAILAWALGIASLPKDDELVVTAPFWRTMKLLNAVGAREILARSTRRADADILALRRRYFLLDWRHQRFAIDAGPIDFRAVARTLPVSDLSGFVLDEGDLALRGKRIDRAPRDVLAATGSLVRERHKALVWLTERTALYSEAVAHT